MCLNQTICRARSSCESMVAADETCSLEDLSIQHKRKFSRKNVPRVSQQLYSNDDQLSVYFTHRALRAAECREKEKFNLVRSKLRYFIPDQFPDSAESCCRPDRIIPTNLEEWLQHKLELIKMARSQHERNARLIQDQVEALHKIPYDKRALNPIFGPEGITFDDGLGPVLCQPTIWSNEHMKHCDIKAGWPSVDEFKRRAPEDMRGNAIDGREFPLPYFRGSSGHLIINPYPLDWAKPVGRANSRAVDRTEQDPDFERHGRSLLGEDLMNFLDGEE